MYLPTHCCGSETMAHHVNKFLISKGHEVRVIIHDDLKAGYNTPYTYEGVYCLRSEEGKRVDTYRWADLVITHLDKTQFTIVQAYQAKRPLVHFVHNDIPYSSIENNFGGVYAVYNSEWIRKALNYPIPSYVLHPPCDTESYKIESSREFITLVSLNERKGGYLFYEIAKAMPDKKFLGVIGSYDNIGPLKLEQINIINLLIQLPNFTLVPNSPDIISTYKRTRILLMPSDYESWGRTATEAMCSGIPVICTPTPGLKENCGDAAIYVGSQIKGEPGEAQVETGNVKEWIKAIRRLDNEQTYKKYSLLCTQRAKALDPLKELEGLEEFFIQSVNSYNEKLHLRR